MFYGRKYELSILQKAKDAHQAQLGILYGRRRVGKSLLLNQLISSSKDIYFEALQKIPTQKQINHFITQLAKQTNSMKVVAQSWQDAFDALTIHIQKGRHFIVFDEFPWMAAGRTELISILKYYWDNIWKKNPGLTLVLCGSITSFMYKHLVHSKALHNRKTFEIRLDSLPSNEGAHFFKGYRSHYEITKFLMTFGGIPKYLEQIDPKQSFSINIDQLCFRKDGFFLNEFETIFKEQFKVIKTYEKILLALAEGSCSKELLAKRLKLIPGGGLTGYLDNLERAEFIRVLKPINIKGPKHKTRRIVLWDEWIRFYLFCMRPYRKIIELNTQLGLFNQLIGSKIDSYLGLAFEKFCIKNLPRIIQAAKIDLADILDYGPYFHQPKRHCLPGDNLAGVQIDLLLLRRGHIITLIECKFQKNPIGSSIIPEIENKIKFLNQGKLYTIEKILISASPVTQDLENSHYFHQTFDLGVLYD